MIRASMALARRALRNALRRPQFLAPLVVFPSMFLAVNVGGLQSTTELPGLAADLFYALGYALWTGVVVVVFVQIIPEAKRRQFKQALDAYEAAQRDEARAGSDQALGDDGAPTAR